MGSPLSPILSNIFMEHFEEAFVETFDNGPRVWWRYVDDVFAIWNRNEEELKIFLDHINKQEPTIKFTLESEQNNQLPFLDIMIQKSSCRLETSVHRKKTHTNRYLHYNSNHHASVKKGIVKCLYNRAKTVCNSNQNLEEEVNLIKSVLRENAYPDQFVEKTIDNIKNNNPPNNHSTQPTGALTSPTHFTTNIIPYVPGLSEKIKRIGHRYDVRTSFRTTNTLRSILTQTKPKNTEESTKNCVYSIPCSCGDSYIGETSRPLEVRQNEHRSYIRNRQITASKISEHILTSTGDHTIEWNRSKILMKEPNQERRKLKETACILLSNNNCFSTNSVEMDLTWLPLLREELKNGRMLIN
jgi:hypothetical protein